MTTTTEGQRSVADHVDASLCQVVRAVFFLACELALFCWSAGCRRVVTGPGVAWPKSWRSGCELAALATESFPGCPPGPRAPAAAARAASGFRGLEMAALICRFSARSAS